MHVYSQQSLSLNLIEPRRQTLPEIKVHARLFGTLEYTFFHDTEIRGLGVSTSLIGYHLLQC